jgi:hypothetical protein
VISTRISSKNKGQTAVFVNSETKATHDTLWSDKMRYEIGTIKKTEYEADIEYSEPLILNTYPDAVELRCARNRDERILGFLGVADKNLEMQED